MSRFYFHVINTKDILDDIGVELVSFDAAKRETLAFAGAILENEPPLDVWDGAPWELQVTDSPSRDTGRILLRLGVAAVDETALAFVDAEHADLKRRLAQVRRLLADPADTLTNQRLSEVAFQIEQELQTMDADAKNETGPNIG